MAIRKLLRRGAAFSVGLLFTVSSIVSSIALPSQQYASALSGTEECDYVFYEETQSRAYDKCQPQCGGDSSKAAFVEQKKLTGKTNREKIYNFWVSQGLTSDQAAGITGSMQAEGGFSPFRQEISQSWPNGGYGIAQFTGQQRTLVTEADPKYNLKTLGEDYTNYYVSTYGGGVGDSGIPAGVPESINDKFLLVELNYLGSWVSTLLPGQYQARIDAAKAGNLPDVGTKKLLEYINTLDTAGDAAKAWTFLYEYPADIQSTANVRAGLADNILKEMTEKAGSGSASCPSGVNCPSGPGAIGDSKGDGSATAIVSAAKCLSLEAGKQAALQAYRECNGGKNYEQPTTNYIELLKKLSIPADCQNASSCATFVSAVLRMAGAEDSFYSPSSTEVDNYLRSSSNYEYLGHVDGSNKSILKAGDIVAIPGHTMIVVADGASMMATASYNVPPDWPGRLPALQAPWWSNPGEYNGYNAYRVK